MSFKVGGEASYSNTKENESSRKATMPVIPDWLDSATRDHVTRFGQLSRIDPVDRVSPSNPWIDEAGDRAATLGRYDPWFQEAASITHATADAPAPRVQAASLLDNFKAYESPYIQSVVDAALADFDYGAGKTRAQQSLDLAGQGAFGGSGSALTRSFTEGELARGRASASSTLREQGFNRAAQLAGEDAQRRQSAAEANARLAADTQQRNLQAAQQMGALSGQHWSNARADIGTLSDMGQLFRGIETDRRQAPFAGAAQDLDLFTGLPLQLFVGSDEQGAANRNSTTRGLKLTATQV